MKSPFIVFFLAVVTFSSCRKDDDGVFEKSADERVAEVLANYQTQLTSAQNGWKAIIYPAGGAGYSFYFKFDDANRVTMLSDFDSTSATTFKESSYRLKALQQPSLLFDTYSYIHVLADPDESVNGGDRGAGLVSDFEYYFDTTSADTIKLTGRFNGSKAVLVKATKAEGDAYNNGQLVRGLSINNILTYFKRLRVGSQAFDIQINSRNRTVTFTWIDGTGVKTFTTNYFLTIDGISLMQPLQLGSQTINGFTNVNFNAASQSVSLSINNETASITGVVVPLAVDVNAPRRWYNDAANSDTYWYSVNGFHVNGVDDAYKVKSLASGTFSYYYYIYYPKFGTNNDLFAPIFLNAAANQLELVYGTAPATPTFTTDGRAVFTERGVYNPVPTTGPSVPTRANLYTPRGFYFVQTSENSYDMVSATDGKSWITWEK
jgi:hypothetical protein